MPKHISKQVRQETADYVADISRELAKIAQRAGHKKISRLLQLAAAASAKRSGK